MIAAAAVVPKAVDAVGKKRAYIVAGVIAAVAGVAVAVAPGSMPAIGIACFGVLGLGLGAINTLIFALQADTVEYGEWKRRPRRGRELRLLSFTRKAGQGDRRGGRGLHDRPRRIRLRRGEPERRRVDLDQGRRRRRSGGHDPGGGRR